MSKHLPDSGAARSRLTVLAIDDQPDNLLSVQALLAESFPELRLVTASSGPRGLALALETDPDAVLLDVVMPGMDGFEVCRRIKADPRTEDIPVVFLTALRTDRDLRVQALAAGAEAFLGKPLDEIELAAQVRAMARLKAAAVRHRGEAARLAALVDARIRDLEESRRAALNLLEDLRAEVVARSRAEQHLRERSEELAAVLDALPAVEWIALDPECRVITGNRAADQLLGLAPGANVSQSALGTGDAVYVKILGRDGTELRPEALPIQRAIALGQAVHGEQLDLRLPGDRRVILLGDAAPLFGADGRPRGAVAAFLDVTERVRLAEQLEAAQRLEAIGRLAGGVAHDFNNLLSVILGYTEIALGALREGDPLRGDLVEIDRAAERARALTRQLLTFSRKQVLDPRVLDLDQLVRELEKLLRRLIGEDLELGIALAAAPGRVLADPGQLELVLMNLAINARDAMPGGGALRIETAAVAAGEVAGRAPAGSTAASWLRLTVRDTGCGMDAAVRSRLFEPFFTTKEQGKGTGLGLATVHGIVAQSGGWIEVTTAPGQGSTFQVYLPRHEGEPDPPGDRTAPPPPARGAETILLVEDEAPVRRVATRMLRAAGYRILAAANAGEALLLCEQHAEPIDLLLTDVVMPQMSGRQLADRLNEVRPGLRVLYMSGYSEDALGPHGGVESGTHFLGKPFDAESLTRKVREVLDAPARAG